MKLADSGLVTHGFRKRRDGIYTYGLTTEIVGWLGLPRGTIGWGRRLVISPVIGVRHQLVERLCAELGALPYHAYIPPTVDCHLASLTRGSVTPHWLFGQESNLQVLVDQLVNAICQFGCSWMATFTTLKAMREAMQDPRYYEPNKHRYRIPVADHLLGQDELAEAGALKYLEELGHQLGPAAEQYREFVTKLLERLHGVRSAEGG